VRLPFTPHGVKEMAVYGGGLLVAGAAAVQLLPWAAPPLLLLALFVFAFFRDPERRPEGGPEAAVAPADGTVADIETVEDPLAPGRRALRIGIFLSVFDVHVNRAPLEGRVVAVRYTPGAFLDARDPDCVVRNESNLVGFVGRRGPFAVRQVAGLIARRIVCPLREGDTVARGERMGLIKFGSRTELYLPAEAGARVEVAVGRKVRGGRTILLRYPA